MSIDMDKLKFPIPQQQQMSKNYEYEPEKTRICGLRGATTVSHNSAEAITKAVDELLNLLETENQLDLNAIASVIFSVTPDLNTLFPASVARQRPGWEQVPLLDVQHMEVANSLERCIRVLIHLNTPLPQQALRPVYLRRATQLRPDLALI
jgi:chorismate mutase